MACFASHLSQKLSDTRLFSAASEKQVIFSNGTDIGMLVKARFCFHCPLTVHDANVAAKFCSVAEDSIKPRAFFTCIIMTLFTRRSSGSTITVFVPSVCFFSIITTLQSDTFQLLGLSSDTRNKNSKLNKHIFTDKPVLL